MSRVGGLTPEGDRISRWLTKKLRHECPPSWEIEHPEGWVDVRKILDDPVGLEDRGDREAASLLRGEAGSDSSRCVMIRGMEARLVRTA